MWFCTKTAREVFAQSYHRARLGGQLEVGHGFSQLAG